MRINMLYTYGIRTVSNNLDTHLCIGKWVDFIVKISILHRKAYTFKMHKKCLNKKRVSLFIHEKYIYLLCL